MKKAGVVETMRGPYDLALVQFLMPEDVIVAPLHVVFQVPFGDSSMRIIDVMDAASQTLVTAKQVRKPTRGISDGMDRRSAAQWLLDIAGVRYGCDVCELEKWV